MTDSYLAPADLDAARRKMMAAAGARCRELGVDPEADQQTIVHLTTSSADDWPITADTACVVADFVLWRFDSGTLNRLTERLEPDKTLFFLEPTADLGWRALVHRLGRRLWRTMLRHSFESDIPAELRSAGLLVTTTDRFGLGPADFRSYVWGAARPVTPG